MFLGETDGETDFPPFINMKNKGIGPFSRFEIVNLQRELIKSVQYHYFLLFTYMHFIVIFQG